MQPSGCLYGARPADDCGLLGRRIRGQGVSPSPKLQLRGILTVCTCEYIDRYRDTGMYIHIYLNLYVHLYIYIYVQMSVSLFIHVSLDLFRE